jgi:hypothetical protein
VGEWEPIAPKAPSTAACLGGESVATAGCPEYSPQRPVSFALDPQVIPGFLHSGWEETPRRAVLESSTLQKAHILAAVDTCQQEKTVPKAAGGRSQHGAKF